MSIVSSRRFVNILAPPATFALCIVLVLILVFGRHSYTASPDIDHPASVTPQTTDNADGADEDKKERLFHMNQDYLNQTERFRRPDAKQVSGAVRLTVFDSVAEPKELDLSGFGKNVITFGREEGNDIQMHSSYVSRKQHGQFRFVGGQWVIEDLGNTNGVVLNGRKVENQRQFHEKDVLLITKSKLVFGGGCAS